MAVQLSLLASGSGGRTGLLRGSWYTYGCTSGCQPKGSCAGPYHHSPQIVHHTPSIVPGYMLARLSPQPGHSACRTH
eukprot:869903-Prorocentrum_minimum.AAC.1